MKRYIFVILMSSILFGFSMPAVACPADRVCLDNPLGDKVTAQDIIGTVIKGVLGVLGSLALFMMVWGGFQWLTSAGNKDKVEKGTKTMVWSIIGVIIALSSYILVDEVLKALSLGN